MGILDDLRTTDRSSNPEFFQRAADEIAKLREQLAEASALVFDMMRQNDARKAELHNTAAKWKQRSEAAEFKLAEQQAFLQSIVDADNASQCSALVPNEHGGLWCKHGHHTILSACKGNAAVPFCMREDREFDEERQVVTLRPVGGWKRTVEVKIW